MKYSALRHYINKTNLQKNHSLEDCKLVIDGNSYFKDTYRDSGCQFVVGPECDKYANYLINKLRRFKESNIKCYVIFKGASKQNMEIRRDKHQAVIEQRRSIEYDLDKPTYFEPLFVKDVQEQVLMALNINYYYCEYDSMSAIVGVARAFKCPVVTNNVEYCLFGVSCILPNNIFYEQSNKTLKCIMYEQEKIKSFFGLYNKTPILLTVLNESIDFSDAIPEWLQCIKNYDIRTMIHWVKRQRNDVITSILKIFTEEKKRKIIQDLFNKIQILYLYPSYHSAVKYFQRCTPYGLYKDNKKWFSKGVSSGRIALPFIDMKRNGLITGSTLVYNKMKPDALEAAIRIIAYSHCVLTNSDTSSLDFIGRKSTSSSIWKINTSFETKIFNRSIFNKRRKSKICTENPFTLFINMIVQKSNSQYNHFVSLKPECRILYLSLVYYLQINKDFIDGAYFVFLSYIMLGHVRKVMKDGQLLTEQNFNDCKIMNGELNFLFNKIDLKHEYNSAVIQYLAEFQHCLQHINYLNRLCGSLLLSTNYCMTYNATFIYNSFIFFKNKDNLMKYLKEKLEGLQPFKIYEYMVSGF